MALSNRSSAGRSSSRNSGGMGMVVFGVAALLLAGGAGGVWYFMRPSAPKLVANGGGAPAPGVSAQPQPVVPAPAPVSAVTHAPVAPPVAVTPAPKPVDPAPVAPGDAPSPAVNTPGAAYAPVAAPAQLTPQTGHVQEELTQGVALIEAGKVIEGRAILSEILFNYTADLKPENAAWIRAKLTDINGTFAYGKRNLTGDDITALYTVKSGDRVDGIANKYKLPRGVLLQVNGLSDPRLMRVDQKMKVILGPVHARIVKHEFRLDLYVLNANGAKIYLKSFPVGLGRDDSTPVGKFHIALNNGPGGKMAKPSWTDPETNQHYNPGDPKNPIGQYWMRLEGLDEATATYHGYGIHGTIDAASVGKQESHGCVRLTDKDIEELFGTLYEVRSNIEILP